MKSFITLFALLMTLIAIAQDTTRPLTRRIIVKTNLLSLVAHRPTITVEKVFSQTFSTEISFVQGEFNNFLLTDHYGYHGFLVRAKKHLTKVDFGRVSPYGALYVGNLKRTIQTTGQVDNSGWIGYPSRDFSANSVRGGATIGVAYFSKSKINLDAAMSLGYGRYTKIYKTDANRNATGYLDAQVSLSVGYCF